MARLFQPKTFARVDAHDIQPDDDVTTSATAHKSTLDVTVLTTLADVEAMADEWIAFVEERATGVNFWLHPATIVASWKHTSVGKVPLVVVIKKDGQICCVAPFAVRTKESPLRFGPVSVPFRPPRTAILYGDSFTHAADFPASRACELVFHALGKHRKFFDIIWFEDLVIPGPIGTYFQQSNDSPFSLVTLSRPSTCPLIVLEDDTSDYLGSFNSKKRERLRYLLRRLEKRVGGPVNVKTFTCEAELDAFFQDANAVFNASWKAEQYGPNRWSRHNLTRQYRELAQRGLWRAWVLTCGDRPVAYIQGFQFKGIYYWKETAYDAEFKNVVPGFAVLYRAVEDLIARNRPSVINFGWGVSRTKETLSNTALQSVSVVIVAPATFTGLQLTVAAQIKKLARHVLRIVKRFSREKTEDRTSI